MKFTKASIKVLQEFIDKSIDDCVEVSEWSSGSGRYTKNRALPPFVIRIEKDCYDGLSKNVILKAKSFFKIHTKNRAVLVLDRDEMFTFLFENSRGKEY